MNIEKHISIIIPVYNNIHHIKECLSTIRKSIYKDFEIIVVDDASTLDIKAQISDDIKYYRLDIQSGPAAARNLGASKTKGDILMFLDSDILVKADTISKMVARFDENPEISAIFGSYDSEPACKDFLSQYKNLVHHFVHQNSSSDAKTFWAGCGAIKKSVFEDAGGFDGGKYNKPSIEDIELGYRLREKNYKIYLDKDIQVKHLKSWNFMNWIRVEIFDRAIPWSRLIVETGNFHSDLNLKISDRISALLVWFILLVTSFLFVDLFIKDINFLMVELSLLLFLSVLVVFLNSKFYKFLLVKRGFLFLIKSIPFHFLYYIYSSLAFAAVWSGFKMGKRGSR